MNSLRRFKSWVVCVAAILVMTPAACSATSTGNAQTPQQLLEQRVPGVDNLAAYATPGELPIMAAAAKALQLPHIYEPTDVEAAKGVIGVAPLGVHCVVIFTNQSGAPGVVAATILARYNHGVTILNADGERPLGEIMPFLDKWRRPCGQAAPIV